VEEEAPRLLDWQLGGDGPAQQAVDGVGDEAVNLVPLEAAAEQAAGRDPHGVRRAGAFLAGAHVLQEGRGARRVVDVVLPQETHEGVGVDEGEARHLVL
jgi:hypothetical protein